MKLAGLKNVELAESVLAELGVGDSRIVLWLLIRSEPGDRLWERIGTSTDPVAIEFGGIYAVAATAMQARQKARGGLRRFLGRTSPEKTVTLPNGESAEQNGQVACFHTRSHAFGFPCTVELLHSRVRERCIRKSQNDATQNDYLLAGHSPRERPFFLTALIAAVQPSAMSPMTHPPLRNALIGEFLGTALLVLLGDGVVASVVLLGKQADWIVITTGWAIAVTLAVYVSGRLSGGHVNPAVTVALASRGDFPWSRVAPYCAAQVTGAFVAATILYYDYGDAFAAFERDHGITSRGALIDGRLPGPFAGGAGVFATYPAFGDPVRNLFSEALGTAVLLFAIRALTDKRNAAPSPAIVPVLFGLVVAAIGLSLGGLTGYAINPARDLGPRLASAVLGWGSSVFRSHNWYFWVPIVGPLIGGVFGAWLYDIAISQRLPEQVEPSPPRIGPG